MTEGNPRYFVGNMLSPTFQEGSRGYFMGFFLAGKVSPDGQPLDILARDDIEMALMTNPGSFPERDESKPHYHNLGCEVTICLQGRLHLIIDQQDEIDLTENQFLVIPPGTVLQNPWNDPGTRILVVRNVSVPGDKFYAEQRD